MTKDDYIKKHRHKMAGGFLCGMASDRNDGPIARAARVFEIPSEVEKFLGKLYDDAHAGPQTAEEAFEIFKGLPTEEKQKLLGKIDASRAQSNGRLAKPETAKIGS